MNRKRLIFSETVFDKIIRKTLCINSENKMYKYEVETEGWTHHIIYFFTGIPLPTSKDYESNKVLKNILVKVVVPSRTSYYTITQETFVLVSLTCQIHFEGEAYNKVYSWKANEYTPLLVGFKK